MMNMHTGLNTATMLSVMMCACPALAEGEPSRSSMSFWHQDVAGTNNGAEDAGVTVQQRSDFSVSASLGALYQIDTDIDGGNNDFSVGRVAAALNFDTVITDTLQLGVTVGYDIASYDFGGTTGFFSGDPWDDIHTFTAGAILQLDLENDWVLFGGPTISASGESGSDFGDGLTGGAIFGASWTVSDTLTLGGGLGIMSQIDDNARVFPVFRVRWQINDRWSLTSRAQGNLITPTFIKLGYQATDTLELSIGGGYLFRRFALDDGPLAPGGVGEDEALAFNLAARWTPSADVTITGLVGTSIAGQLTTENTAGVVLAEQDYDPGLFFGAIVSIRF